MGLTCDELKRQLHYDPLTGDFRWLVHENRNSKIGDIAGSKHSQGYIQIYVKGKLYLAHRLAWLYMNGYFPESDIDHINRVRDDNRIINLREVSRQCNSRNCKTFTTNTSGIAGLCWDKKCEKWRARIMVNNKHIHLGVYESKTDAIKARWEAEVKYGFPNCNTTSTAYQYLKEKGEL